MKKSAVPVLKLVRFSVRRRAHRHLRKKASERENTAEQECERKRRGRTGPAGERKEKSERERERTEIHGEKSEPTHPATAADRPQRQSGHSPKRTSEPAVAVEKEPI